MFSFFFFNDTATTEIYTLSLHDALPISSPCRAERRRRTAAGSTTSTSSSGRRAGWSASFRDRKSTRLNSSHDQISYAVFCLKKKKTVNPCVGLINVIQPKRGPPLLLGRR